MRSPLMISTLAYEGFARSVAQRLYAQSGVEVELAQVERRLFPDGERYQRVLSEVHERSVILVGGTVSDADTLCLYDLACACVKYGARRLELCIPYFGYSTMERATKAGEVVTAKTRARLLSAIPLADRGNHFYLLDLHSEGIPHYFEGDVTAQHLSARGPLLARLKEINGGDFVLGSADSGRAKWVEAFADALGVDAALILKRRLSDRQTEVSSINAHVEGRVVVLYDDMIRTGSSLIQASRAYREAGASAVWAACSHGVFPRGAWERLQAEGGFEAVLSTNSHPRAQALQAEGLELIDVAPVFAEALAARAM